MKKTLLLALLMLTIGQRALACDACGCAAGANYLGILPLVEKNLFGYRFQYSYFPSPVNPETPGDFVEDIYRQHDVWVRLYPTDRWQVFIQVPYKVNTRTWNNHSTTIQGVGDVSMMAHYLFVQPDSGAAGWRHFFRAGPMVKMPTGKYQQRDDQLAMLPAMMQTGNGAWGLGANAVYTLRNNNWGANLAVQANWNAENELMYQLGMQYSSALTLFHSKDVGKATFMPQAGLLWEHFDADQSAFGVETATGATRLSTQLGMDVYVGRWMVSAFGVLPLQQDIPDSQPEFRFRVGMGVSYFF